MRLIFIRHGQAEDMAFDHNDAHRELTASGRERLENAYPSLARYLNTKNHCEVWTSPKTRAQQTAAVLCRYTPAIAPEEKSFLSEGDFDAFCKALAKHDHGETIVVVGHEPYLSEWVREMTGLDVHFKKGCGEMLYLAPKHPRHAIRINNIDFNNMKNFDLYSMPIGIGVATLIERQHKLIIKARDHFLTDPDDSDALSQLRVALRAQYALLEFIRPYCKRRAFASAEKRYLSLYDDLENLRGINAILKSIHNSRKLELVPLADALLIEQNTAVMDLCDQLSHPDSEAAYNDALHLTIAALMTSEQTAPLEQLAREQFTSRYQLVQQAIFNTDFSKLEEIEALRILCKTSRYLFEFFSPLADYRLSKQYRRIRRLNQRLSAICDTTYNLEQLQYLLGEDDSPALSRAIKAYSQMMAQDAAVQNASISPLVEEMREEIQEEKERKKQKKKKITTEKKHADKKKRK